MHPWLFCFFSLFLKLKLFSEMFLMKFHVREETLRYVVDLVVSDLHINQFICNLIQLSVNIFKISLAQKGLPPLRLAQSGILTLNLAQRGLLFPSLAQRGLLILILAWRGYLFQTRVQCKHQAMTKVLGGSCL